MTDEKLYLAIGIPSALFALNFIGVLAAAFWQSKRFDDMSKRLDDMGKRLEDTKDSLKSEIARVEGVLGAKIDRLSDRVEAPEEGARARLVK